MNESGRQHRREEEEEEEEEEEGEDDLKQDIYDFNVVVFVSAASRFPISHFHLPSASLSTPFHFESKIFFFFSRQKMKIN